MILNYVIKLFTVSELGCNTYVNDVIDKAFTSVVKGAVVTLAHVIHRPGTEPTWTESSSAN